MAGITKNLGSFTPGSGNSQDFVVNSSLSNIIISNSSSTLDIYVTVAVSLSGLAVSNLVKGIKIPPTVSLNLLENNELRVQTAKAKIYYEEPTANTPNLMTVTYTSS